jgi:hypothetical protein
MFANPIVAYQSFEKAMPGQQGDRNVFRLPHHATADAGLSKIVHLPQFESPTLKIGREVLNIATSQPFGSLVYAALGQGPLGLAQQ